MTDRKATLTAILVDSVSGPARKIQAEITGIGTSVGRVNNILQGIGQGIGQAFFAGVTRIVETLSEAIPKLLDQGNAYLEQLRQIQLETGMTAEQTSTLVGTMKNLGVPTEDLDVLFARLGANLGKNEGLFRQLGVATRDSNGAMLSGAQVIDNIRRAVQAHGASLLTTAAAQELFGRSGFRLLEYFQASDQEIAVATENMRRWGGVVSQAAVDGAHRLKTTLDSLSQGITDIGVNIAAAVDPYLRAFVDSFAKFVQAHLQEIINFAVAVVNTVTGFISGLFGITDALDVSGTKVEASTGKAAAGTDNFGKVVKAAAGGVNAFTTAIQNQIKAIDAHIHAIESAAQRRRATQERARLADSLAAAQAQLADLKGNDPFLGGLSAAEQALAVQKHAQDIIDAEKNVQDQRKAIGDFEADQKDRAERELLNRQKDRLQQRLTAAKAADTAMLQSGLRMGAGLDQGIGTVLGNLGIKSQEFGKTAAAAFKAGVDAGKAFLDILLGAEQHGPHGGPGVRTGGIIGAIGGVGGALKLVGDAFGFFADVVRIFVDTLGIMADRIRGIIGKLNDFWNSLFTPAPGSINPHTGKPFVPRAAGGFVPATPGGQLNLLGEGGEGEWVIPESKVRQLGGGVTINVYNEFLSKPSDEQIREVTDKISRRIAFSLNHSPVTSLPNGAF